MASKIVLFAFAALCICQITAKPGAGKGDNLETLATQTGNVLNTFNEEFKKIFEIKETKESKQITDSLKTNANEFAGKLTEVLAGLNKEIKAHSGDVSNAVTALKEKVSETVKKIQEEHPTETAKAQEYQKQIETLYNDVYNKAKEAAEAVAKDTSGIQEDFGKFTHNVLEAVKTNAEKINTDLKKSIEQHNKEHKH
ncbi:hypothetical protein CBL_02347 [Carabus blaptoides fortunei]